MRSQSILVLAMALATPSVLGCTGGADRGVTGPRRDSGTVVVDAAMPGADTGAASTGLPCDVAGVVTQCLLCHGATPAGGAPMAMVTYEDMVAPSPTMPGTSVAALSVTRMRDTTSPMPPGRTPTASAADIAILETWIAAGTPRGTCGQPTDPYGTPVVCTSGTHWTRGNHGSQLMRPGGTCNACHDSGEGPDYPLTIAGTVYPTAHEPDDCNGAPEQGAITIDIIGADGQVLTLTPNSVGNFMSSDPVALPLTAAVHYQGRTRTMVTAQPSGDCNTCHSEAGNTGAPGRIMLP